MDKPTNADFYPGEYSKTWVFTPRREPLAILNALRAGSMFTVLGDLIDRLELSALAGSRAARMGSNLLLSRAGEDVDVKVRVRVPAKPNFGGRALRLHHIDVIAGDIVGPATDRDGITNPTTRVVAQVSAGEMTREGLYLSFSRRFRSVRKPFYVRLRGTNTDVEAPRMDTPNVDPWSDLWFYSNPVFVRVP
jgi:hypothetical protein